MKDYGRRIESLKAVEVLIYSLCVHLLNEETKAVKAAKAALLDLFADEGFPRLAGEEREKRARRRAIARALEFNMYEGSVTG